MGVKRPTCTSATTSPTSDRIVSPSGDGSPRGLSRCSARSSGSAPATHADCVRHLSTSLMIQTGWFEQRRALGLADYLAEVRNLAVNGQLTTFVIVGRTAVCYGGSSQPVSAMRCSLTPISLPASPTDNVRSVTLLSTYIRDYVSSRVQCHSLGRRRVIWCCFGTLRVSSEQPNT